MAPVSGSAAVSAAAFAVASAVASAGASAGASDAFAAASPEVRRLEGPALAKHPKRPGKQHSWC